MKKTIGNLLYVLMVVSLFLLANGCNNSTVVTQATTYDNNTINGTITFVDTNYFIYSDTSKGYYDIAAYPKTGWPPTGPATANFTLIVKKVGSSYTADYKLVLPTTSGTVDYVVTSAFIKKPYGPGAVLGLGTLHSDTSHSMGVIFGTPSKVATIIDNQGIGNINFLSWVDTTMQIYKF